MKELWYKISHLGIDKSLHRERDEKRLIFFNQVVFIGILFTPSQIVLTWPFIQEKALFFTVAIAALFVCMVLNSNSKFQASKWVYLISIYSVGIGTTVLLGGATLYHLQAILMFLSCLVIFDYETEKVPIFVGIPIIFLCFAIGELFLFNAPDFEAHELTYITRWANISGIVVVSAIMVLFIVRLNSKNEKALYGALTTVLDQTEKLEQIKENLESMVHERTSELKDQKELLQRQNDEKETLLKEVHHRVRNNLQIIVSLINLQSEKITDQNSVHALREIQGRVESMSLVHKKMYQTANFENINMFDYMVFVIQNIRKIYNCESCSSTLEVPKELVLKMETAIPFGLVVNEMISNYFKHVYQAKGGRFFNIVVSIDGDNLQLLYTDNGEGFEEDRKAEISDSLGIQLISSLIEQLEGNFKFYNGDHGGAVYEMVVPKKMLN